MGNSGSLFFSENAVLRSVPRRRCPVRGSDCRKRTTIMKRAIHFGAGKIGPRFYRRPAVAGRIRGLFRGGGSADGGRDQPAAGLYGPCDGRNLRRAADRRRVGRAGRTAGEAIRRLVDADLVTTAVGLGVLPRVAPVIAAGLRARKAAGVAAPLNVVACENGVRATSRLKASVYEALDAPTAAWAERTVGFADCSVDRIVPPVAFPEPLDVAAEAFHEWNVERSAWVGRTAATVGNAPDRRVGGAHRTQALHAEHGTLRDGLSGTSQRVCHHRRGARRRADFRASARCDAAERGEALIRKVRFRQGAARRLTSTPCCGGSAIRGCAIR